MYYEELHDGVWERIDIDGEMLTGRAHHVIYFASPARWLQYPRWARERRDEIIARIKSAFREPDYEYYGVSAGGAPAASGPLDTSVPPPAPSARSPATAPQGSRALLVAVLLLLAIAAGMMWLVVNGLLQGETVLPIRQAYLRRTLSRLQEPAMFWLAIGLYTSIGVGALTLGVLGVRAWRRLRT
jgi:hypothetical protein